MTELQTLLNAQGARLKVDGVFGPRVERALRAFQAKRGLPNDGVAGEATRRGLGQAPEEAAPKIERPAPTVTDEAPRARIQLVGTDFCFPLAARPKLDWHTGARFFGARRDGGRRRHAGCDLIGSKGTPIFAIADGTLVRPPYPFYSGTWALEVRHGPFVVRYGEILPGSVTRAKTVRKGDLICKIGLLNSGSSMLHFEMYSNGSDSSPLTVRHGPFMRRADVMDPAPLLDQWAAQMAK